MRVAERAGGLARGVCAKNTRRRRGSRARAVYGFAVGGPVACEEGSVVVVAKGEAGRFSRSVVAGRDLPLPRFSEARGGVMNILLATFARFWGLAGPSTEN